MSLINQMLKDIDQRDRQESAKGQVSSKYTPNKKYRSPWFYVSSGLVASVAFMLILLWILKPGKEPESSEQVMAGQLTAEQESPATNLSQHAPVQARPTQSSANQTEHAQPVPMASDVAESNTRNEAVSSDGQTEEVALAETSSSESQASVDVNAVVESSSEVDETTRDQPAGEMTISQSDASPREIAQRYFDQGVQLLASGQQRQGAARLQEALLLAPEFHDAREELALYYFSRGFLSDSLLILERGLERFPNQPRLLLLQARILERSGQERMALELLRGVPARFPQHADLLSLRAVLAEQLESYELAIGTYESLLAWRADQGTWWLGLGLSYDAIGNSESAKRAYRSALTDPTLAQASRSYIQQRLEALQ